MNLFVYGTLMSPRIMKTVVGFWPEMRRTKIRGFMKITVKGSYYPLLVRLLPDGETPHCMPGLLWKDVPEKALEDMCTFEGKGYHLEEVTTIMNEKCMLFVPNDCPTERWSLEEFEGKLDGGRKRK